MLKNMYSVHRVAFLIARRGYIKPLTDSITFLGWVKDGIQKSVISSGLSKWVYSIDQTINKKNLPITFFLNETLVRSVIQYT